MTANTDFADLEIKGLFVNDCAGASQVIACSGSTGTLENITVDGVEHSPDNFQTTYKYRWVTPTFLYAIMNETDFRSLLMVYQQKCGDMLFKSLL